MQFNATRNTIQGTLNFCAAFILNRPSVNVANAYQEPALTIANLILSTVLSPPFVWQWNRNFVNVPLVVGQSDYTVFLADFGWLEDATISLSSMNPPVVALQINPMFAASGKNNRPFQIAVVNDDNAGNITFRFMAIPDQTYTATLIYQKAPVFATSLFGASVGSITSIAAASGGTTVYNFSGGVTNFTALVGTYVWVTGTTVSGSSFPNNGLFLVTASTNTSLTLQNPNGVLQAGAGGIAQPATTWAPIPDKFNFLYERGMLAHLHGIYDATTYLQELEIFFRQLVGCSEGLSDTAKAIFLEDRLAQLRTQAAVQNATTATPKKAQ